VATACDCVGLCPGRGRVPQCGVVEIHNEQGPPSYATKVQGLGKDQAGPR